MSSMGESMPKKKQLRLGVLGDSTCSVRETMHAICDGQPFLYCDRKIDGAKSSLEFRFAMVPRVAGEKVMVKAGDGSRERFRSQRTSLSEFDAIFVVFNDHDQFDSDSHAAQYVRGAAEDGAV